MSAESTPDNRKVQILAYPCCKVVYSVCAAPYCYTSKDWAKQLKKAVKGGDIIDTVTNDEYRDMEFGKCKCKREIEL